MTDTVKDMFVDGIANVSYNSGAFRFELVSIDPTEKDAKGNPTINRHMRVVMTPQGFLQASGVMQSFVKQVEEKGIIRRENVQNEDLDHAEA